VEFLSRKLLKAIDSISEWSGRVMALLLFPGLVVLLYEIGSRYMFDNPTVWAHGTTQRIFAGYFMVGGAYALLHRKHVNMDLFYGSRSPRIKAALDIATSVFFFAFAITLVWKGSAFAWNSLRQLECCGTPFHAPLYPVKLMVPFGGVILLLQGFAKLIRDLTTVIRGGSFVH